MKNGKDLVLDILKALKIGCLLGILIGVVLFFGGFLAGGFQLLSGLEVAKDGLLLLTALGLFLIAGMLLVKGKNSEKFTQKDSWKKHFHVLGYRSVLGVLCAACLTVAAVVDYIMMQMK